MIGEHLRPSLTTACLSRETVGVRYEDQDGVQCALVGRIINVRARHVVFALTRGAEQALPIDAIRAIERGPAGSKAEATEGP